MIKKTKKAENIKDKKLIVNNWFLVKNSDKNPPNPAPRPAAIPHVEKFNTLASGKLSLLTTFGKAASEAGIYAQLTTPRSENDKRINTTFSVDTEYIISNTAHPDKNSDIDITTFRSNLSAKNPPKLPSMT